MKIKTISSAVAFSTLLLSGAAFAAADGTPKVFGTLNAGVTKVASETDIDGTAFEASLGVKGGFQKEGLKLRYTLEAEFTNAVNDDQGKDELEIKKALIALPTSKGLFVIAARGESAQQRELYKPVDIFEVNEADNSTLWNQPDEASAVLAYVTPWFNNTHIGIAAVTLNSDKDANGKKNINHNGEEADAIALRVIHKAENLYLGAGLVSVSDKQLPTNDTYYRTVLSGAYTFNKLRVGAAWEHNDQHPAGDIDVVGVTADYRIDEKWSVGVGYTDKDADKDALDDNATLLIVRNQLFEDVFAYAEVADYDVRNDNYSLGIRIDF